jgi:hypothetical protein
METLQHTVLIPMVDSLLLDVMLGPEAEVKKVHRHSLLHVDYLA